MCKYGIEYVDDPATGKKIPTCHRSSFDSVLDDSNFEQAQENADRTARRVYREEAKAIEELRKNILEVSDREEPYDIFICYKESDENGTRTLDSVLAQDMGKVGAMQDLLRGIEKILRKKEAAGENGAAQQVSGQSANADSLLKRALLYLEDGEWQNADETVAVVGNNYYGQCHVSDWKIFSDLEVLEQKRETRLAEIAEEMEMLF